MKYVPNCISVFRIIATICLLFIKPFTTEFCVIYTLAGVSDILDGWIARSTNNTSTTGAKLDSMADLLYYAVMVLKIFPVLLKRLPIAIWCMLGVIFLMRFICYGIVAIKYGQFASLHTYLNKLTGAIVFLIPFVIKSSFSTVFCTIGCIVAFVASVEELLIHLQRKKSGRYYRK